MLLEPFPQSDAQNGLPSAFGHYEKLLDLASDCLFAWDGDGRIVYWNQAAERCYGWSKAESQGQLLQTLLNPQWPLLLSEIQAVCLEQDRWSGRVLQRHRGGTPIWVETTLSVGRADESGPTFCSAIALSQA